MQDEAFDTVGTSDCTGYRSTQDLRLTQELLGHGSPATTAIYAAADTTKAAPAVMALGISNQPSGQSTVT